MIPDTVLLGSAKVESPGNPSHLGPSSTALAVTNASQSSAAQINILNTGSSPLSVKYQLEFVIEFVP